MIIPELRAELLGSKQELLSALDQESGKPAGEDATAAEAFREIGGLLAIAYQRYRGVQRVQTDQRGASKLALSSEPSVHGVVT
jgi:hypothetical protein